MEMPEDWTDEFGFEDLKEEDDKVKEKVTKSK